MQQSLPSIPHNRHSFHVLATIAGLLALGVTVIALPGCGEAPATHQSPDKPLAGVTLTLSCPDAAFAEAIDPMVRSWESRRGAKVTVKREVMSPTDESDIGIIPAASLGAWAEPGHLAGLPAKLRGGDNAFQWFGLLAASSDRLLQWGSEAYAVPLTGDGFVLVYRKDRFGDKAISADFQQYKPRPGVPKTNSTDPIAPPVTWDEFAKLAAFLAERDKKPSLPPLPTDPDRLFDLFSRVASSFDRQALTDAELAKRGGGDLLSFQFTLQTGKPRLQSKGFQEAAAWLGGLHAAGCLPPAPANDDPVAALAENRAVFALLSLDQLARMPRENGVVPTRFAIAAVPGSRTYFSPEKNTLVESPSTNYVPHFSGGRLGVVRTRCQNPDAAFELLAEIGGPARSAELVSTPGLGAGPTRVSHLDPDRMLLWLGYGFDAERSKDLQNAMRQCVAQSVKNPTFGLRGPDRVALTAAAGDAIRKIGTGAAKPGDALAEVEKAWNALDANTPESTLLRWRQRAAGQ